MTADTINLETASERLLELDYALRQAIDQKDGLLAQDLVQQHSELLHHVFDRDNPDHHPQIRAACDRLQNQIERAQTALTRIRGDLQQTDAQRKLVGAPTATVASPNSSRSFTA
jgi:hypothetical protein